MAQIYAKQTKMTTMVLNAHNDVGAWDDMLKVIPDMELVDWDYRTERDDRQAQSFDAFVFEEQGMAEQWKWLRRSLLFQGGNYEPQGIV
jgi:hypothetical protein